MEKSLKNCTPKLVPDAFLTLEITQNNHCMQEILLEIRHYERRSSKSYRKLILIFLLNTVSFNRQDYEQQKRSGTNDQLLFRLQNKVIKIHFLMMYLT